MPFALHLNFRNRSFLIILGVLIIFAVTPYNQRDTKRCISHGDGVRSDPLRLESDGQAQDPLGLGNESSARAVPARANSRGAALELQPWCREVGSQYSSHVSTRRVRFIQALVECRES